MKEIKLPPAALLELAKLIKMTDKALKKERKQVEKLMERIPQKESITHQAAKNLLFLINFVQEERKKSK